MSLPQWCTVARRLLIQVVISVVLPFFSSSATALELSYGGRLSTASGEPVAGPVSITFRFFREASGGSALATIVQADISLLDGVFQTAIPLSSSERALVFGTGDEAVYIEVESQGKIYPRQKFSYVPLALRVPVDGSKIVYDNEGRLTLGSTVGTSTGDLPGATSTGLVEKVGEQSYSTFAITNAGKSLITAADAASQRALLGLGSLGTRNSLSLADMSGISCPSGDILRRDSSGWSCESLSPSMLSSSVSQAEFDYLDGLTGAIQTQLNSKLSASGGAIAGSLILGTGNELRFGSSSAANFVGFKAPANMPTSNVYTLPGAFGSNGQVLSTDANGGLSWTSIPVTSVNGQSGSVSLTTDYISETASRKYFSQALARQSISSMGLLSYNSSTGVFSLSDTLLTKSGGTMSGSLDFAGTLNVTNLADPVNAGDAAKKSYVDGKLGGQPLVVGTPSPGQVVKWDGSKFALASDELGQPGGGIASLNTLTSGSQSLAVETPGVSSGTRPTWTADSGTSTHRLSIPMASGIGVTAGLIAKSDYDLFIAKQDAVTPSSTLNAGTITSNLQNGLQIKPYGSESSQTGELRFQELTGNGSQYIGLKAPDALTADTLWTLPSSDGPSGYVLSTDGTGTLSWISPTTGSVTSIITGTGLAGGPISGAGTISLADVGTAGTYTKVTTNAQGQVISGNSLGESDIPSLSAGKITSGSLSVALGGTGATSFTNNGILVGSGASPLSATAAGTPYQVLRAGAGGAPAFGAITLDQSAAVTGMLPIANGGTGAATAAAARTNLGAAGLGANSDITSLTGLTTPLSVSQGGTGAATAAANTLLAAPNGSSGAPSFRSLVAADIPSLDAGKITTGTLSNGLVNWASPGAIGANTPSSGAFTTMTTSGNVGIGTTAPTHTFQVGSGAADGQSVAIRGYSNGTNWKGGAAFGFSTANVIMGENSGVAQIGGHNGTLGAWSNLAINAGGGNVGIGTAAPSDKLDVAGNVTLTSSGSSTITMGYGGLSKITSSFGPEWDTNNLDFYVHGDLTLGIKRNYNSGIKTIYMDSNVGIGTISPAHRLDVSGSVRTIDGGLFLTNTAKVPSTGVTWAMYNMTGVYGNSLQFWAYDNIGCAPGGLCANRLTISDNGNVGISNNLTVNGGITRRIPRVKGNGPNDQTDNGIVSSRSFTFTKTGGPETSIRILYNDNLRAYNPTNNGGSCRWEIKLNGNSCASGAIYQDIHAYLVAQNDHAPGSIVGYCDNLTAGTYTIAVYVSTPGVSAVAADCYTGWYNSHWVLEAEEVL
jgi:hypothetical protein